MVASDSSTSNQVVKTNDNIISDRQNKFYPTYVKQRNSNTGMSNINMQHSANNSNSSYFSIFHQNIRGIFHKVDELLYSIAPISPQILCLTEHHLREDELKTMKFTPYTLGAHFCRQSHKNGGVSIYVSSNIQFYPIDLKNFNKERDLEICALKIDLSPSYLIMVCIYRSPNGDFEYFINQLEAILNNIYIKEE